MENKFSKEDLIRVAIYCWNIASNPEHGATYNVNEIVEKYIDEHLLCRENFSKIYQGYLIIAVNSTDYNYKVRRIISGDTDGFYRASDVPHEILKQAINYDEYLEEIQGG